MKRNVRSCVEKFLVTISFVVHPIAMRRRNRSISNRLKPAGTPAAASLVILLIWVYYSSQILPLGAEFTHCYASRYRRRDAATPTPLDRAA
jgi:hypothetical protein